MTKHSADLIPVSDLCRLESTHNDEWEMTGGDPHFHIDIKLDVPGYYHLSATMRFGPQNLVQPKLYLDRGAGFNEDDVIPLRFIRKRGNRYVALLPIPWPVRALRLDPSIAPGKLHICKVSFVAISDRQRALWMLNALTRARVRNSGNLRLYLVRAASILMRSGPRALMRAVAASYTHLEASALIGAHQSAGERRHSTIENIEPYASEYQPPEDFSGAHADVKVLAFHLPQFHACPQNDQWWGEGFTEWTNTRRAKPRFANHYQPRTPHSDIGFYDLSNVENIKRQFDMAEKYGIFGFCFYYYWFSGKRILEKPLDLILENDDIDGNFCLCWANENWTRTWDGENNNILLEQEYLRDDPEKFIDDIGVYLRDRRYIRIDGKPVILVYKPQVIPDVGRVFDMWRRTWRELTGEGLLIWCVRTDYADTSFKSLRQRADIDAVVEFPPHAVPYVVDQSRLNMSTNGHLFDYQAFASDIMEGTEITQTPTCDFHRSVMLGWDNSARRQEGWSVWYGFSLKTYYRWLSHTVEYTRKSFAPERRFLFINAWNEWAEGTYLEPDELCGYASLNTTAKAIYGLPFERGILVPRPGLPVAGTERKVAVHLHFFFEEMADEMASYLSNIPFPFDLIVTTDTEEKAAIIRDVMQPMERARLLDVIVTENRGRDVGPLLRAVGSRLLQYEFFAHIHTKKSTTVNWGDRWRHYLLNNLMGSSDTVESIFREFDENPSLGVQYPSNYPLIEPYADWAGLRERSSDLLERLGRGVLLPETPKFPAGSMFWARTGAMKALLRHQWTEEDFEEEQGQTGETLSHCIERLWTYVGSRDGYTSAEILSRNNVSAVQRQNVKRLAIFIHYDEAGLVSEQDMFLLESVRAKCDEVFLVSHSALPPHVRTGLTAICSNILIRENEGFDFFAWRQAIEAIGRERLASFDELLLVNNSTIGPVVPLDEMLNSMADEDCDFWGITAFPRTSHSARAEAALLQDGIIPKHLQSYFLMFRSAVLRSDAFWDFWTSVHVKEDIVDVVAAYEAQLTPKLAGAGFKWASYLPEAAIMQDRNIFDPEYNTPYSDPVSMLKLRSPLIKKKIWKYAAETETVQDLISRLGFYPYKVSD